MDKASFTIYRPLESDLNFAYLFAQAETIIKLLADALFRVVFFKFEQPSFLYPWRKVFCYHQAGMKKIVAFVADGKHWLKATWI